MEVEVEAGVDVDADVFVCVLFWVVEVNLTDLGTSTILRRVARRQDDRMTG